MDLTNRIALVTGGTTGIGKQIAIDLAKRNCNVVVNYYVGPEEANEVVKELTSFGVKALAIQADVSNFEDSKRLVDQVVKEFGGLDIVVNNAGITRDGLILRMDEAQFDSVINTNLKGVFNVCKHSSKYLLRSKFGRIINISSVSGIMGNVGQVNYAASKAGVIGLTKTLAREFASRGVTVNAVAPGFIETAMTKQLPEAIINEVVSQIPLKAFGQPEDISNLCIFLASDLAKYITGTVIQVDGGLAM